MPLYLKQTPHITQPMRIIQFTRIRIEYTGKSECFTYTWASVLFLVAYLTHLLFVYNGFFEYYLDRQTHTYIIVNNKL